MATEPAVCEHIPPACSSPGSNRRAEAHGSPLHEVEVFEGEGRACCATGVPDDGALHRRHRGLPRRDRRRLRTDDGASCPQGPLRRGVHLPVQSSGPARPRPASHREWFVPEDVAQRPSEPAHRGDPRFVQAVDQRRSEVGRVEEILVERIRPGILRHDASAAPGATRPWRFRGNETEIGCYLNGAPHPKPREPTFVARSFPKADGHPVAVPAPAVASRPCEAVRELAGTGSRRGAGRRLRDGQCGP